MIFLYFCFVGDIIFRLCLVVEIKFYFSSFVRRDEVIMVYVKFNVNCNLVKWVFGCELGWSCNVDDDKKFDIKNGKVFLFRICKC